MSTPLDPRKLKITKRQAQHLAKLTRLPADELVGKAQGDLADLAGFRLDPQLLLYRQLCGRVVKKNQLSGELEGVPNATVHVEDTDCSFLGFFPVDHPYFWLFPFFCTTEEIATVTTDECGRFCVWVPRWDVDRYLRWRKRWRCHFERPRIEDVLRPRLPDPRPEPIPRPFPLPDPPPFLIDHDRLDGAGGLIDHNVLRRISDARSTGGLTAAGGEAERLLELPLFRRDIAPPVPEELRDPDRLRTVAAIDDRAFEEIELSHYLGPFLRCEVEWIPEWHTFLDIPDLTFRVTQDVDGDGDEEVIYDEGFFDVRWNDDSSSVTLEASSEAISTPACEPVPIVCQNQASIEAVGAMDLEPAYHDDTTGYAQRINRPRAAPGLFTSTPVHPANAPYCRWLMLFGCHRIDGATHYRMRYRFKANPAGTFSAEQPFTGHSWSAPRQGPGAPIPFIPDADGWYEVVPAADLVHPNWLFYWPTPAYANGIYEVRIELGKLAGGTIGSQGFSPHRTFTVENTRATAQFLEVRWRPDAGSAPWTNAGSTALDLTNCPQIERLPGQTIQLRVHWLASAPHLRSARLGASGCGGGSPTWETGLTTREHWHTGPADNTVDRTAVVSIPGSAKAGCYHLAISAHGRQCNPSGVNGGASLNWEIDQHYGYVHLSRSVAIVDS